MTNHQEDRAYKMASIAIQYLQYYITDFVWQTLHKQHGMVGKLKIPSEISIENIIISILYTVQW